MLKFLRTGGSRFFLLGLLLAVSCKKADTTAPADPKGSFDVTFTPAASIRNVSVGIPGSANSIASQTPDATGYLKIDYLSAGTYVLSFDAASGYTAPTAQNITIAANANTALGTVRVVQTAPANTNVPYALQGTTGWTTMLAATAATGSLTTTATSAALSGSVVYYNSNPTQLTIKGIYQSGSLSETVQITLPGYGGPGQYTLGNLTGGGLGTYVRTEGGATTYSLSSQATGSQGTLTVATHNTTARTLTGTFGFNLYTSAGKASGTITNGTFTANY